MRALTIALTVLTFSGALLLLLGTASLAQAQQIDANGDGVVTPAEARLFESQRFAAFDANGDLVVTVEEWNRASDRRFARFDADGDGLLQPDELASAQYGGVYTPPRYGADSVGATSVEGLQAGKNDGSYVPSAAEMAPPGPAYQPAPQSYQPANAPEAEAYYAATLGSGDPLALDADGSGALTLDEVRRYNDGNFARHDIDRSGWLSPAEWDLKAQEHFGYRVNPAPLQTLTEDTFSEHDLDGDGRITKYEWDSRVQNEFAILDLDRDGRVSPSEIARTGVY